MFEWFMILFGWLAAVLFIAVSGYKIAKIARMPLNVRWEVYPVPHEPADRRNYGGSYMEQVDWVNKPRVTNPLAEYLEMAAEIFALKRVKEHNVYNVWLWSLAMHWGIYLYFGWLFLLVADLFLNAPILALATNVVGVAAGALGAAGALALAVKRATQRELKLYTTPLDYFNLVFIASFFVAGLASWLGDLSFAAHKSYIGSVLFFKPAAAPFAVSLSFLLFELFLIYMPFSKLIHYFAKFFTFHHALWDDEYKEKGSARDFQIVKQLTYAVQWSGPHIVKGKSWLAQAQTPLQESEKK
ncbi:MAG: respiratory nitrate reductase subunit gamma [Chloroflexi bacterium]|nr:respiratory nitrate reductase subunit gamma [Chloroflexota bacterium]